MTSKKINNENKKETTDPIIVEEDESGKEKEKSPSTSTSELGYMGTITCTVTRGRNNKKISSTKYHNAGTDRLFSFFSYCLAGRYNNAQNLAPAKIKLFTNDFNESSFTLDELNDAESNNNTFNCTPISTFIYYFSPPVVTQNNKSTIFHFIVPESTLFEISSGNTVIKEIRIYPANATGDNDHLASAYFISPSDTVEGEYEWSGEIIQPSSNYNLLLDWEMKVNNGGQE